MTDDERLLEIATRLMAARISNPEWDRSEPHDYAAQRSLSAASELLFAWRERTGAQGREQDIPDALLDKAIRFVATNTGDDADAVYCTLRSVQRARAAGKGEE